jgi:hypothetical protein
MVRSSGNSPLLPMFTDVAQATTGNAEHERQQAGFSRASRSTVVCGRLELGCVLDSTQAQYSELTMTRSRADFNVITSLETSDTMPKLRVLRLSNNKLRSLNGAAFPNLRTLYADNNSIVGLDKASRLSKLENLSLRNQSGKGLYVRSIGRGVPLSHCTGNFVFAMSAM